jgi:MarC family integral membrane protein
MVFGVRIRRDSEAAEQAVEEHVRNIAAFPLAIPLMAGPGAITATVLLAGHAHGNWLLIAVLLAMIAVVSACCVVAFFCWPHQRASWHDWKYRAITPSWRATRRIGCSICGRRRARDLK